MSKLTLADATPAQIHALHQYRRHLLSYERTVTYAVHGGLCTQTRAAPSEAYLPEAELFAKMVAAGYFA